MIDNYYYILGLDNFATHAEIKAAYRNLAKKYHPDRNIGKPNYETKFLRISEAYRILSNLEQKTRFDEKLRYSQNPIRHSTHQPVYATRKTEYTKEAKLYGKIFVVILILAVIGIPLGLKFYSSISFYNKGVEFQQQGELYKAVFEFESAITRFGGRSLMAATKASEICIYGLQDYDKGLKYTQLGLQYADNAMDSAYFHFLKGIAYYGSNQPQKAMASYQIAGLLNYYQDSLQLKLAYLNAFGLQNTVEAEKNFDYLLSKNIKPASAWFGKGWCDQLKNNYRAAIEDYNQVLAINKSSAITYFYRGINHLQLLDTLSACNDLRSAYSLGYQFPNQYLDICDTDSLSNLK